MLTIFFRVLLVIVAAGLFQSNAGQAPSSEGEKVILVDLTVDSPSEAKKCYSTQYDSKTVELDVTFDDPMYSLSDYILEEEKLEGPDCFFPEMKLIFREYTYVVSLYCTSVVKYSNSKPYTPSNRIAKNDLYFTETVLDVLSDVRQKYFGKSSNVTIAQKFLKNVPIGTTETVDDSFLYKSDEEEKNDAQDDKDLENDAIDAEGIFDETKDPDLEIKATDDEDDGK